MQYDTLSLQKRTCPVIYVNHSVLELMNYLLKRAGKEFLFHVSAATTLIHSVKDNLDLVQGWPAQESHNKVRSLAENFHNVF